MKLVLNWKMEIKIFKNDEISKNLDQLAWAASDFGYGDIDHCKEIIRGSQVVGVVFSGDVVIGFGRIVGDGVRFSYIVDLNVSKSHRNKGIGTKLVQKLAESVQTKHIDLTTDPNIPWLKDFYLKAGFELSENEHVFGWLKK